MNDLIMIIAITGGSGFIGRELVKYYLQTSHQVRILTRKNLPKNVKYISFIGDLTDPNVNLSEFLDNVDILYHCAGELANESLMNELHINGTQRLINQAKGNVDRWVQLSSVGAYGTCRSGIINEESLEHPFGAYEISKTSSDELVKNSGIPYTILRPSIVFGEQMTNNSIHKMISMINNGMFFYIGKSGAILNYIHVSKVVKSMIKCGNSMNAIGEVFIISQSMSIEKMVSIVLRSHGKKKQVYRFPEWIIRLIVFILKFIPNFPLTPSRINALTGRCIYNSTKIHKLLNFELKTSLEEDFKSLVKEK